MLLALIMWGMSSYFWTSASGMALVGWSLWWGAAITQHCFTLCNKEDVSIKNLNFQQSRVKGNILKSEKDTKGRLALGLKAQGFPPHKEWQ